MEGLVDRFRSNEAECAAKVIDGEAVIINLRNGTYYSLDGVGGTVWELLSTGRSVPEIVDLLVARFDVDAPRARADVDRLVAELLAEKLLVGANGDLPAGATSDESPAGMQAAAEGRAAYAEPALVTYRDMADLLALDPPMPRLEDLAWGEGEGEADPAAPKA